jgi:hypothetical protein
MILEAFPVYMLLAMSKKNLPSLKVSGTYESIRCRGRKAMKYSASHAVQTSQNSPRHKAITSSAKY